MLTVAAASLLVGVAAILLPNSVVVLALGGLVDVPAHAGVSPKQ